MLGEEGATVYVTGRSVRGGETTLGRPGTIDETADEVSARGGTGIAVRCDHTDDTQVDTVFARIVRDHGRLDLLVNNAWSGYELSPDPLLAFWDIDWRHWGLMFDGGLRAAAYAARCAAPMMVEARHGLIVNITVVFDEPHGHAFYVVMKSALNVLTQQLADDLRPHDVAVVGVAPGWMRLERMNLTVEQAAQTESPEFPGRAVAALASDPNVLERSGLVLRTPDLARDYGFTDVDGSQISPWWLETLRRQEAQQVRSGASLNCPRPGRA